MAKLTLSDLANLNNQTSAVTTINNNSAAIETALENTLSRDGTSPNQMGADLDLNGFDVINVGNIFLDGDVIEADVIADYVDWNETAAPAAPSANTLRLYAVDASGVSRFQYKDASGNTRNIILTDSNDNISHTAPGGFFLDEDGATDVHFARFDRIMAGEANTMSGNLAEPHATAPFDVSANGANWGIRDAQICSIAKTGRIAITGASVSSMNPLGISTASIGVAGFCINDTANKTAWALYGDVQHEEGNFSYGLELAIKNVSTEIIAPTAHFQDFNTTGIWMVAGGDRSYGGVAGAGTSVGLALGGDTSNFAEEGFYTGIVIFNNSLIVNPNTGFFTAISLAKDYRVHWGFAGGNTGASINSAVDTVNNHVHQFFTNRAVSWRGAGGGIFFQARYDASYVNYVDVRAVATGSSPIISAVGTDTNVNLTLNGQGTGGIIVNAFTNTGLHILDTDASHDLIVSPGSNLTADRTLTVTTGDSNRTLNISAADVTVSSFGATLVDDSSARTACATLGTWNVLGASGVQASHTGNTTETTLATISIPAGAMGANGALRIRAHGTCTSSANNKTPRIRLGGLAGTAYFNTVQTTTANWQAEIVIQNRNSAASQVSQGFVNRGTDSLISSITPITGTINTANAQDIVITVQLANTGETITLEGYVVELYSQA